MIKNETPDTPRPSSPARKPTINLPPITPISKSPQLKARTPSNKFVTYKECLANDRAARKSAISLVKQTDEYIFEMDHQKRDLMLETAAQETDAKRIRDGEHVSCLFEEAQETPLSPEEAAEVWETTKREIAAKTSGLRGKPKSKVTMVPTKMARRDEKIEIEESVIDLARDVDVASEMLTSNGLPVMVIDDD
ncbi:hypothetical protein KCU81_g4273, partial [Aureobasidium melanogenum]|uniref:Uncharacterized protein n=1 Tax=Aureobasidium melanogenum (strain CBS 110374) TaxID=1043003 RepID=A0A074VPX7_AURM1